MKLVTVSEMRAIEQEADSSGLTFAQMMENAGSGLAEVVLDMTLEDDNKPSVVGLVGPGNNGGDTLVALSHLSTKGWRVHAYLITRSADKDPLVERVHQAGGEIISASLDKNHELLKAFIGSATVVMDGILGTGFKLPLKREIADVMNEVNNAIGRMDWPPFVVAVDCPSGVDCDTGKVADEAIPASITMTMAAVKEGLVKFPAFELVGDLQVVDIGLTGEISSWKNIQDDVADDSIVAEILPDRPDDSHKGTFGTAVIAAGSINYTGAAMLAGKSAYKIGAGLVKMAVPGPLHQTLAGQFPEATWVLLPHEMGVISGEAADVLLKNLDRATALLVGPGIGSEETTKTFIENLIKGRPAAKKSAARIGFVHDEKGPEEEKINALPPMVVDADGLRLLKKIEGWEKLLPSMTILTPHPGEMAELTGLAVEQIQEDRLGIAKSFAKRWGHVVVLKGAFSVIAAPDGRSSTIPVATSALAKAGTGDVLAGIIVGLLAQGVEPYAAAVAGTWIHAQAGLLALDQRGSSASVLASDVVESIGDVLFSLE